jgi:hypothetical protein
MPDYRVPRSEATESLPDIIEPLADAWVDASQPAVRRRILDSATRGQRLLLAYHWYWDEATNGGHRQYFWNYTGNLWPVTLEATRVLRLPEGKVLASAIALFPRRQPGLTMRERREQLRAIGPERFEKVDDRLYGLSGDDGKLRRFIDRHPDEFFRPMRSGRGT